MSENPQTNQRRRWMSFLAFVVLVAAAGYGAYWILYASRFETTDDAYVGGDIVPITSSENGKVLAIHADNTQTVSRGMILVELDPARARVAVQATEAELAKTVRRVKA